MNVEASGYALKVTPEGGTFHAVLSSPGKQHDVELFRWESLERVCETMATHFAGIGKREVWAALRASLDAAAVAL